MTFRSRRQWRAAGVLLLFSGLLAGAQDTAESAPPIPSRDFTGQTACTVLKVAAGNELVVRLNDEETRIRLIGTYVPQSGLAADEARTFATRLLQGESVYIGFEPDWPERDREERRWAYVYRAPDGLFVNLELVRLGYARVSAAEPFEHQNLLRAYERIAQKGHKGLWGERAAAAEAEPTSRPTTQPAAAPAAAPEGVIVYVTEHGKKYHRQDCQHVRGGAIAVTLQAAKARGCTPCLRCKPPTE